SPGNLENPAVPRGVGPHGHCDAPRSGDHRRLHKRVGGSLRGGICERSLVCSRGRVTYKCVRTANGFPGTAALSAQAKWSACTSEDGQHCDLGVYKSPARRALPVTTPLCDSPAPMGSEARPVPQGSSYTRSPQLRCGAVIEGRSSSSRLVPSPTSDRSDLGAFFQGAGGPVRKQAEHLLPALVLARGRRSPTRHRRAGPPVASSSPICFPPIPLLQQVLCRMGDEGRELILIAPHWPTQPWVADLVNMSVQQPWELPLWRDLLTQAHR